MLFNKIKDPERGINILSKCDTLASYDFYNTIVSLDSVDLGQIEEGFRLVSESIRDSGKLNFAAYERIKLIQPLAHHEYAHYIDSTSSLWGAKYLYLMNNAYMSDSERFGGVETDFHYAKEFFDLIRFAKLPDYYTTIARHVDSSTPWSYQETIGKRFSSSGEISDYPIIFTSFGNTRGERIVRSPISTVSILECSAMAQEVICNMGILLSLEGDEKYVEVQSYTNSLLEYIYNRELTEYSVCAHLLANIHKHKDVAEAYRSCAIICRYVLNFPTALYERIANDVDLSQVLSFERAEWIEGIKQGMIYRDPGFLFYLICNLLPEDSIGSEINTVKGINVAFEKLGIDLCEIKKESDLEFNLYLSELSVSKLEKIRTISAAGYDNYKKIDWDEPLLSLDNLNIPPVLLNDGATYNIINKKENMLCGLDLDELFDELFAGEKWVKRFSESCS